ncbi:hypothetical protein ORN12_02815 [Pantoea vagans]|uniref:hypothetical protein n=1 Tax=Pantoea vagans TaxID=470934 RepID=UPI00224DE5D0|nr:hypothetical protein [Pantoea vagans]MCX3307943.1 hypothetical protein [Pantoea vagans]
MKMKLLTLILASAYLLPAIANEPASSKKLPTIENGFMASVCGHFDGEPASPELVSKAFDAIKSDSYGLTIFFDEASAKRVAKAYAYRDRNGGGSCEANVQEEYWAPKNQPK